MSCFQSLFDFLFLYETPKVVHIRSKKIGILGRFLQLCILSHVIGYVMVYNKGYQEFGKVESAVITKVKGVAFSQPDALPEIYRRVWDTTDLVIPPSENSAFFVTTNMIITPNQTRGTCSENPEVQGALCSSSSDCPMGEILPLGSGILTGRCIGSASKLDANVCEVSSWCPVEVDDLSTNSELPFLPQTANFTVLIKNFIEFPTFGKAYRRRNILESMNKTYLQSCVYHSVNDPYCPVFRLEDILTNAGENFTQVGVKGGVIVITITWNCNLDWDFMEYCLPAYSFRRADDPNTQIAPGWNFRHAEYHEENRRTLIKAYGIRFIVDVTGHAGKFSIIPTLLNVGSGFALFGLTTILCDFFILYFTKKRYFYKEIKYHLVNGDSGTGSESPLLQRRSYMAV